MDSPAIIVARFLQSNHYSEVSTFKRVQNLSCALVTKDFQQTLDAFLREAGLPADAGTTSKGDLTIERILEEKKIFDLTLRIEKVGVGDEEKRWSVPAPSLPTQVSTLPSATNLLHVSVERIEDERSQEPLQLLFATTADRRLHIITPDSTFSLVKSISHLQDSPNLSCVSLGKDCLRTITSGMSGQVVVYDHKKDIVLDERRDHNKYVVKVAICDENEAIWVATAGWDAKIFLYRIMNGGSSKLGEPVASIVLATNPETVTFIQHPNLRHPNLLVTRRDSTSLHYYPLPAMDDLSIPSPPLELKLLGSQNLAPHSNAWIAFSPSSIAICPTDPTLLAVATSAVPYMKLIIVRLLIPSLGPSASSPGPTTQVAQTRATLATQDLENAAIFVHVSTLAPQTPYSTPQVVWRPDGSGVWVNGDDGILRGLEAKTGKIISTLKEGHEVGSRIRSLWCGMVDVDGKQEEWLVSGGFDRRLVVWRPDRET